MAKSQAKPLAGGAGRIVTGPILVALGANLPSERFGAPRKTLEAALDELSRRGVQPIRRSRWYESAPVPASSQPWYLNGVVAVETTLDPPGLLAVLHQIEAWLGRIRREPNGPRAADLDLIAHGATIRHEAAPILPHPRMSARAFVLLPLAEVAPGWRHPESGLSVEELIARLPGGQDLHPLPEALSQ
jgi:2-amino-4-hydroxy-6-hydroxymethyldihydropteridine diphosphokinase